jgi:hypothetical protein
MHRTRWGSSKPEQHEVVRIAAPGAGPVSLPGGSHGLTPSEVHAAQRSATLTAAQSRRRGVLPG